MRVGCRSTSPFLLVAAVMIAGGEAWGDSFFIPGPDNYANTVLSQNPYLYWRLNETTGTVAADTSGNSRTGTYTGPTLGASGPQSPTYPGLTSPNNAPQFNGNDNNNRVTTTLAGLGTGDYSASFWVRNTLPLSPVPSGHTAYLFNRSDTTSTSTADQLGISGSALTPAGRLFLWNGGASTISGSTVMNPGDWYHVVLTRSGSTVTGYLNGAVEFSGTFASTFTSGNPLITIGTRQDFLFDLLGNMDEFALFNRALTLSEVQAEYNSAFSAYVPPVTPEPASIALFSLAGLSMAGIAWRRRAKLARLQASN